MWCSITWVEIAASYCCFYMSGMGLGCMKTQTPTPIPQQVNREGSVDESLLRRNPA
jgi:hypothetical protein